MARAIETTTVTVNPAFLQEIKEVNEELWSLLSACRKAACEPIKDLEQARAFVSMLEELREKLAMHFALEEDYGYFEGPMQVAPQLACRSEELRREHATLYLELLAIIDHAKAISQSESTLPMFVAIQSSFITFDDHLRRHEEAEASLIQEAFSQEFGGED